MATFIKFMSRDLVKWKRIQKAKMAANKMLSIFILKLNKLHVLLLFSTYKLRENILWSVKN